MSDTIQDESPLFCVYCGAPYSDNPCPKRMGYKHTTYLVRGEMSESELHCKRCGKLAFGGEVA